MLHGVSTDFYDHFSLFFRQWNAGISGRLIKHWYGYTCISHTCISNFYHYFYYISGIMYTYRPKSEFDHSSLNEFSHFGLFSTTNGWLFHLIINADQLDAVIQWMKCNIVILWISYFRKPTRIIVTYGCTQPLMYWYGRPYECMDEAFSL